MTDNTEREALARLIDAHYDDYEPVYNEGGEAVSSTLAEAILASDVWRNRQTEAVSVAPAPPCECSCHLFPGQVYHVAPCCYPSVPSIAARPVITDEVALAVAEERESHKYTLTIGSNPPEAVCTCGWRGPYAHEWRLHRERAALEAAFGENHQSTERQENR